MIDYEFNGLPLHPLLVHLVVVIVPVAALCTVLVALWPAARRRLGIVTPLIALIALITVPITVNAGQWLQAHVPQTDAIASHALLGPTLLPWTIAVFVVAGIQWAWYRWGGSVNGGLRLAITLILAAAVVVTAVGSVVTVVRIGESGTTAVWKGRINP